MRKVTYEMNGITYKTLAEAPKGAQTVLTEVKEPYVPTKSAERRKMAIMTKCAYSDYKTPGTR